MPIPKAPRPPDFQCEETTCTRERQCRKQASLTGVSSNSDATAWEFVEFPCTRIATVMSVNRPSIWHYLPQPERDCVPPQDREDRQVYSGYWIFYNRDGSVSLGTETREYFGALPAEIVRAVPESVINCIACTVFDADQPERTSVKPLRECAEWRPLPRLPGFFCRRGTVIGGRQQEEDREGAMGENSPLERVTSAAEGRADGRGCYCRLAPMAWSVFSPLPTDDHGSSPLGQVTAAHGRSWPVMESGSVRNAAARAVSAGSASPPGRGGCKQLLKRPLHHLRATSRPRLMMRRLKRSSRRWLRD
jgi:hypothetical protein